MRCSRLQQIPAGLATLGQDGPVTDGVADAERGLRSFVVGTGGARLYPLNATRAHSEFQDNTAHGLLRLTLEDGRYSWAFVPTGGGAARDRGSAACRR